MVAAFEAELPLGLCPEWFGAAGGWGGWMPKSHDKRNQRVKSAQPWLFDILSHTHLLFLLCCDRLFSIVCVRASANSTSEFENMGNRGLCEGLDLRFLNLKTGFPVSAFQLVVWIVAWCLRPVSWSLHKNQAKSDPTPRSKPAKGQPRSASLFAQAFRQA